MKHSQKVQIKDREKKKATEKDVSEAILKAQSQLGNLGEASETVDKLMGDLESGTCAARRSGDRRSWWKGAFEESGLAAPDMADVYEGLKKKGGRNTVQPEAESDNTEDENMDEASTEDSQCKGLRLNDVQRNRAVRTAQKIVDDVQSQMNLMITKGRAAASELEGDMDSTRFRAEVSVLNWRLRGTRTVMNVDNKELEEARMDLATLKQELGTPQPSGVQAEEASASGGASTAEAAMARSKAAPSPSFEEIMLFADFAEMTNDIMMCVTTDDLKESVALMKTAKSHLTSLLGSLQAAIQDAYLARKLYRKSKEGPSKQEDKRRQQVDAAQAGEERLRKKAKKTVEFSVLNSDHPEDLVVPSFETPQLREFLGSASPQDVRSLFSSPFIIKKVGWVGDIAGAPPSSSVPALGAQPAAAGNSGAQPGQVAAAVSPVAAWLATLGVELQHFRALFDSSSRKAGGGRAALSLQDAAAKEELFKLVRGAFPRGWVRTQSHSDIPPDLLDLLVPTFYGLAANSKLVSFEKCFMASVRLATCGGVRKIVQGRFTEVGQHVRALKGKDTELPSATDTFEWLMREATADGINDMITQGTPLFWGTVDVGDALYTPAGAIVLDGQGQDDGIGIRIPVIAQWDDMASQEFAACQADYTLRNKAKNPSVEELLKYITKMRESGAQPDSQALAWELPPPGAAAALPLPAGELPPPGAAAAQSLPAGIGEQPQEGHDAAAAEEKKDEDDTPRPEDGLGAAPKDKEEEEGAPELADTTTAGAEGEKNEKDAPPVPEGTAGIDDDKSSGGGDTPRLGAVKEKEEDRDGAPLPPEDPAAGLDEVKKNEDDEDKAGNVEQPEQ